MMPIIFFSLAALGICLLLTPVVRRFALRFGLTDKPNSDRKIHTRAIPRIGGVGIALSWLISLLLLAILSPFPLSQLPGPAKLSLSEVLGAIILVFMVGLLDDIYGLSPWQKMVGLIGAATWVWSAGVRVLGVAGFATDGVWSLPLTVLWLVSCTNAFNLIDGLDGLAAGLGLCATLTLGLAAILNGQADLALVMAPLAGALFAFLLYNFYPASIFLGDSGSLFIGFVLACCGAIWTQKSATFLAISVPMMALAVPLLDTVLAIVRRFLRSQPIFSADADHIHHRLLKRGLSQRNVVVILYLVCTLGALFSLLESTYQGRFALPILALFLVMVWIGVRTLAYPEFRALRRLIENGKLRKLLSTELSLSGLEQALRSAASLEECWTAIREASKTFGYHGIAMSVSGRFYEHIDSVAGPHSFKVRVMLGERDFVELICTDPAAQSLSTVLFSQLIHRQITAAAYGTKVRTSVA